MGMLDGLVGQIAQQALAQGGQQGGGLGGMLGGLLGGQQSGGLGSMLGGLLGGGQPQADQPAGGTNLGGISPQILVTLLPAVLAWVQQQGGISNAISTLTNSGLGTQVQSWVGTGANQAVDPQALSQLLGSDKIAQVAAQVGVSPEQVQSGLAALLPQVVNHLTPNGDTTNAEEANSDISAVLGKLSSFF